MTDPNTIDRDLPCGGADDCPICAPLPTGCLTPPQAGMMHMAGVPVVAMPIAPAPHNGTPTSKEAAESLTPETLKGLRRRVYDLISARTANGIGTTSDDAEEILQMRHQTVSARVNELANAGLIIPAGRKLTRSRRTAVAYVVAKGGGK